jgi:tRNA pseudouridine55 synthase
VSAVAKREKRAISGVLLLDKPIGVSSNGALQHAKRLYRAAKAGHTGNLDPIATGLLPVCFGEATKFSQYLTDSDKRYEAVIKLGETTDTGDAEGQILERHPVAVTLAQIEAVLPQFVGEIAQVPPMYSALKHQGRPLYDYARKGVEIERAARQVTIHEIVLLGFDGETLRIAVDCSKGTYIRVLAEDIGKALGCGAHMTGLRRTRVGAFSLDDGVTLEQLEAMADCERDALLLPVDVLIQAFPSIFLDRDSAFYFRRGQAIWQPRLEAHRLYRIYDDKQSFIGIAEATEEGKLAPRRLVVGA